jgi:hypothetical protein
MRFLLYLALGLGFATSAFAETLRLRAGEHSGYTRLVLDGAASLDWIIGRTATGYALRPDGADVDYALDGARRDIRAGRVTDLKADGAALYLDLGCTCQLKTYTLSGNRLVLDIAPGNPDASLAIEQPFPDLEPDPAPEPVAAEVVAPEPEADLSQGVETAGKWLTADPSEASAVALPDFVSGVLSGPVSAPSSGTPAEAALAAAPDYSEFEAMLTETLARAAAEGFVNAPAGATVAGIDAVPTDVAGAEGHTAYDVARGDLPEPVSDETCRAAEALDFLNDATAYEEQTVGPLLREAYDDEGVLKDAGALDLARFLMWRGYGAEASQLFDLIGIEGDEGMLLATAALALDGKSAPGDFPLESFGACDGAGGLWSLLAGADADLTGRIDLPAAITVYSAYPAHLRRMIGPLLATHLITHGYMAEARLVANVIPEEAESDPSPDAEHADDAEVASGPVPHDPSLTDLTLEAAEGEDVVSALDEHIAKSTPDLHDAVLLQSQAKTAEGVEPDAAEIETLQALQADAGQGELRDELFATELRRLLDSSNFNAVISRAAEADPAALTPEAMALESEAWSGLIALGSNLDVALAMRRWPDRAAKADLAPGIRERLAERLGEIGPVVADPAPDTEPAATVAEVSPAPESVSVADDPKPVAAAKSTLEALKDERAALQAILNGTEPPAE